MSSISVGDDAPALRLESHLGSAFDLGEALGTNVVIVFFPLAFTPV